MDSGAPEGKVGPQVNMLSNNAGPQVNMLLNNGAPHYLHLNYLIIYILIYYVNMIRWKIQSGLTDTKLLNPCFKLLLKNDQPYMCR